jgi:hypothetical protein
MNVTLLAILGGFIILGLAGYAGYLLLQLKKQEALQRLHNELAVKKRNANIYDNVTTLCSVGIQGQCDLAEISIRIYCIMDYVQGPERVDVDQTYPALSELYHVVKDMPRGEDRQSQVKKERMENNLTRYKAETRLHDAIVIELKSLQREIKKLNNIIDVQLV